MTDTSVASDLLQTFDVHSDFSTKISFYNLTLIDNCAESLYFIVCQISAACVRIYSSFF